MVRRRVVCAAIRDSEGCLVVGPRHYDATMTVQISNHKMPWRFANRTGDDQGFIDQFGGYMTRSEAYSVAEDAGQIINRDARLSRTILVASGSGLRSKFVYELTSECLY